MAEFEHSLGFNITSEGALVEPHKFKTTGYKAGDKLPAPHFNWFLNKTSRTIEELQECFKTMVGGKFVDGTAVPIKSGGTGAVTAQNALANLGGLTFGQRIAINNNTDLNDLVEIGCYGCTMTSTAETLSNSPVKVAFILDVINSVGGPYKDLNTPYVYLVQRLLTFDGREYIRPIYVDGKLDRHFSSWQQIAWKSDIKLTAEEVHAVPYFLGTVNGTEFTFDTATSLGTYGVSWVDCPAESSPRGVKGTVYGTLLCHINNGYHKNNYNWLTQIFVQASNTMATHDIYVRRKINADQFTAWDRIALITDHEHGTEFLEKGNLNDIKAVGYYFAMGSNTCTNTPIDTSTTGFGLEVLKVAGSLLSQVCTVQDCQYIRYFNGSTWQPWRMIYNTLYKPTPAEIGALPDTVVPINKGGTGASDVTNARKNLNFVTGTYTGTGNSGGGTMYNYDTGARGSNVIMIHGVNARGFLCPWGGFMIYENGGWNTTKTVAFGQNAAEKAYYENGYIKLHSNHDYINVSGGLFNYCCL